MAKYFIASQHGIISSLRRILNSMINQIWAALFEGTGDIVAKSLTVTGNDTLLMSGDAATWDDFSVPLTRDKQGQSAKPDYDFTNLGLLFPQNDDTEIVYLVFQMSHSKKMDSQISFHIHYIQSGATQPTFKIDYKFYLNGATVPGSWTTLSTADGSKGVLPYTAGDMMQKAIFPYITPPTNETVSANIDIKFYRDDNDVAGDVLGKYIDFHFSKDMTGSRLELTK